MKYNVTIKDNNLHSGVFNNYGDARDYCEVISYAFDIPLFMFRINDRDIESYKLQNIVYKSNGENNGKPTKPQRTL